MISKHHEHSFDLDLIDRGQWVLDVGCRGFALPEMLSAKGINVLAVDADPEVKRLPEMYTNLAIAQTGQIVFMRAAVVHRELAANKRLTLWKHPHDQQAHSIVRQASGATAVSVPTASIPTMMAKVPGRLTQFALIKLDCEGAEYRLMHDIADAAAAGEFWARQISCEYHDHCGLNPEADMESWYRRLHARLEPYYDIAKHVREVPPWNGPAHYVDSLYILRKEFWK